MCCSRRADPSAPPHPLASSGVASATSAEVEVAASHSHPNPHPVEHLTSYPPPTAPLRLQPPVGGLPRHPRHHAWGNDPVVVPSIEDPTAANAMLRQSVRPPEPHTPTAQTTPLHPSVDLHKTSHQWLHVKLPCGTHLLPWTFTIPMHVLLLLVLRSTSVNR